MAAEHPVVMRDGSNKRADELHEGESVMPFYRKVDRNSKKLFDRYEKIYNPNSGKYEFTHRLIAESVSKDNDDFNTVHHIDFNKYNNSPSNLRWMDYHEHHKMHGDMARSMWKDPIKRENIIKKLSEKAYKRYSETEFPNEVREKISKTLKLRYSEGVFDHLKEENSKRITEYNKSEEHKELARKNGRKRGYLDSFREYNESDLHKEHDEIRRKSNIDKWRDSEIRENTQKKMKISFDDFVWDSIKNAILDGIVYDRKTILNFINENLIDHLIEINDNVRLRNNRSISRTILESRLKVQGYKSLGYYFKSISDEYEIPSHALSIILSNYAHSEINEEKNATVFSEDVWNAIRFGVISRQIEKYDELESYFNEYIASMMPVGFKLTRAIFDKKVAELGFNSSYDYIKSIKKNHKVKSIEWVGGDDVYCMTVVGLNGEDDRHNFALRTYNEDGSVSESGFFVRNSIDNDIFIPTRTPDAPTPIDTLPAGSNLTAIDDIKFIQNKVLTALRIPKSFLNFEEAARRW